MQVGSSYLLSATLGRSMTDLRTQFDDLTRQLSSMRVSDTYSGLGSGRVTSMAMRARISQIDGYRDTITTVNTRLSLMSKSLTQIDKLGAEQRSNTDPTDNSLIQNGQTRAQLDARSRLEETLSLLGSDFAGSYLFAGRNTDANPMTTVDKILNGDGTQVGLRAVIDERRIADVGIVDTDLAGTDQIGRLTIGATAGTSFAITEDGVHPFGFKLAGGATTIPGASVTVPAGSPPSLDVSLTQQPVEGQTLRLTLNLPDGTTTDINLTASTTATANDGSEFLIGATPADTLENLRSAIVGKLSTHSRTTLAAASSVVAANDFFAAGSNTPPKRVDATFPATLATATALRDATPTDTLVWYKGDDDPAFSARESATAQVDTGININFGVRANEAGITRVVANLAIMAAEVYPAGDPDAADRNTAITERARAGLAPKNDVGSITAISTELAGAQRSAAAAKSRHDITANTAQDLVDNVEKANDQEVAAAILAIQTRLQATYQTTSMLAKLSLVNYV